MKPRVALGIAAIACAVVHGEEATDKKLNPGSLAQIQHEILSKIPEGWEIARSPSKIVLTLRNAQFLNSINQPIASEEVLWSEYAWKADFVIEIRFTPGLSQEEYNMLIAGREALRNARVKKVPFYGGPYRNQIEYFVEKTIPLPLCKIGTTSIWISSNDRLGHHWVRPASAKRIERELIETINARGQKYKRAQQGGGGKRRGG